MLYVGDVTDNKRYVSRLSQCFNGIVTVQTDGYLNKFMVQAYLSAFVFPPAYDCIGKIHSKFPTIVSGCVIRRYSLLIIKANAFFEILEEY